MRFQMANLNFGIGYVTAVSCVNDSSGSIKSCLGGGFRKET